MGSPTTERDQPWTILRVLSWTAERFAREGLDSPRLDAEVLLAHSLGQPRIGLYLDHDKPLAAEELTRIRGLVRRRLAREPVAYLTGVREFWSLPVRVDRRVLIPRPETELLVEAGRDLVRDLDAPLVVEVGVGSGAVLIALGRELPAARLFGCELDAAALDLATQNLAAHQVTAELRQGDLLAPLPADLRPQLILSNPPYVPSAELERLAPEVRDWEPRAALDGGPDGLQTIRRLIPQAAERLAPGGWLGLEIGAGQAEAVGGLMESAGLREIRGHRDLAGRDRVIVGRHPALVG